MSGVRTPLGFSDLDAFIAASGDVLATTVRALYLCPSGSIAVIRLPADPEALTLALARLVAAPHDYGVDHIDLIQQLTLWHSIDGAERHVVNAPATAVVAAHGLADVFGPDGLLWGPALLTGCPDRRGGLTDLDLSAMYAGARSALPSCRWRSRPAHRHDDRAPAQDARTERSAPTGPPAPTARSKSVAGPHPTAGVEPHDQLQRL